MARSAKRERLYFRDHADRWPRDVNGYAICPNCGAMIHERYTEIHADACQRLEEPTDGE
jgi:hypothetical protein